MRSKSILLTQAVICFLATVAAEAADWPQWRGPERDGISAETGLLKSWPEDGPKLIWKVDDIGHGFSTPSIVGARLYLLSNEGLEDEYVQSRSVEDGREIWKRRIGKVGNPDQKPSYPGARSTPTIEGERLWALGSDGDLVCLATRSGEPLWKRSLRTDFDGKPGIWAYSESPLVDGNRLVCTPGGDTATLVALNKTSGEVVWKCALDPGDTAAYASPVVLEVGGLRQYVQLLENGLVGVAAKTGSVLWRWGKPVSRFKANIPTPVVGNATVYVGSAGTGGGAVKIHKGDDGLEARELYFSPRLPTAIGGCVKVGDHLYGTTRESLVCLDFATGNVKWQARSLGSSSICHADVRLYLHGENGDLALVEASPEGYREHGRFTPAGQPERENGARAWAYPAIANGRLYIRDLGSLWCYDIRAASASAD